VLSGRGLCDELITRPEESFRQCCVVVCDLETSRIGAPYIYNVRLLRIKGRPILLCCQALPDFRNNVPFLEVAQPAPLVLSGKDNMEMKMNLEQCSPNVLRSRAPFGFEK